MYTNIAFYKFVCIEDPAAFQAEINALCLSLNLKGTIIVAKEGINSCLVGQEASIDQFIDHMRRDERFSDIDFKKSFSERVPFRRMLVKLKKEIIPMGFEYVQPAKSTGKYVQALELKQWLDNQEDLVILDTRNDYEVEVGTFREAINPNLKMFRDFPEWVETQLKTHEDWKTKKVITFCTGGIRCEKATAFMQHIGFENVYQLQGGILKYFEETHRAAKNEDNHFDGECFVFDYRVAVDKNLDPTSQYSVCFNCWNTLTQEDLTRPEFKQNVSCHHCAHKQKTYAKCS
jgi:UPF0176 protein